MFGKINNLDITGVLSGESTLKAQVKSRSTHLLIYKISGESVYYLRGKRYVLTPGSVLYVPEGETYKFKKTSSGESLYYLVNFHAEIENDVPPVIICNDKNERALKSFKDLNKKWLEIHSSDSEYEITACFYRLLSVVMSCRKHVYTTQKQKGKIELAVSYLEEHVYDKGLKISELSKLSGMSEVMFRKIFHSRFETSPKQYIIQNRMQTAKAIFENGEFESIAEVAKKVGYEDPLHFSKSFKQFFGVSPANIG